MKGSYLCNLLYLFLKALLLIQIQVQLKIQAVDVDVDREATNDQHFIVIMKTITNVRLVQNSIRSSFSPETYNITHKYSYLMKGGCASK